jgi:hypothetical protein
MRRRVPLASWSYPAIQPLGRVLIGAVVASRYAVITKHSSPAMPS